MPNVEWCIECDTPTQIIDWRGLCLKCAEKEDYEREEKNMG